MPGTSEATRSLLWTKKWRHRPQEVSLSPLCWDFPLRNIVGFQLGQKHSCVEEQEEEEEGGYEEEEMEEGEKREGKGLGRGSGKQEAGEDALVGV